MTLWLVEHLGKDVPLHFSAFHPDWKMLDHPPTPHATLSRAREIAMANGLKYVYTGNVHDKSGGSTYCSNCGQLLIGRDWYELSDWHLDKQGRCQQCGEMCAGVFSQHAGSWGARRQPVDMSNY